MFQNWMSIQDFVVGHQKEILREAEAARAREALRPSNRRKARPSREASRMRERGSCLDCPGQVGAAAGNA
jgi:hypothetical protein